MTNIIAKMLKFRYPNNHSFEDNGDVAISKRFEEFVSIMKKHDLRRMNSDSPSDHGIGVHHDHTGQIYFYTPCNFVGENPELRVWHTYSENIVGCGTHLCFANLDRYGSEGLITDIKNFYNNSQIDTKNFSLMDLVDLMPRN